MNHSKRIRDQEAQKVFDAYMAEQPSIWEELAEEALLRAGIQADFTTQSVPKVVEWLYKRLRTTPLEEDPSVPEFIRKTESYKENLFEFDGESRLWICRAGFYLGESFVRRWDCLKWTIGQKGNFEENMPVVAGFIAGQEMSPIQVVDVICSRGVTGSNVRFEMARAIEAWAEDIPETVSPKGS